MNFREKIVITIGESLGAVLGMAMIGGALLTIIKFITIKLLKRIGVEHFVELAESYRWIGQILIESRAIFNADRASYYRASNGKSYLEDGTIESNKNINVVSIVNVVKNKGMNLLPERLDRKYFDWFLKIQNQDDYVQYFIQDFDPLSPVRNELKKYDVLSYMCIKVKFDTDLYGIIIYTWSDEKAIPKNLITKHREYLDDIRNSTLIETATIVSRSIKFKLHEIMNGVKI